MTEATASWVFGRDHAARGYSSRPGAPPMAAGITRRRGASWARSLAVIGLALLALIQPLAAAAQETRIPQVGVIDLQRILRESSAVKKLSREVETLRARYQDDLVREEAAFREADHQLARVRSELSPEVYDQRRRELESKAAALQRDFQERKKQLDQIFGKGMSQIQQVLLQVSQEIAAERGLDLLFAKATVVLVKPDLEITNEALARLNAQLAEVEIPALEK